MPNLIWTKITNAFLAVDVALNETKARNLRNNAAFGRKHLIATGNLSIPDSPAGDQTKTFELEDSRTWLNKMLRMTVILHLDDAENASLELGDVATGGTNVGATYDPDDGYIEFSTYAGGMAQIVDVFKIQNGASKRELARFLETPGLIDFFAYIYVNASNNLELSFIRDNYGSQGNGNGTASTYYLNYRFLLEILDPSNDDDI